MTNFQVYKKTLSFSLVEFLVNLGVLIIVAGLSVGGFFIAVNQAPEFALVGLLVGLVIGIIAAVLINIFITNRIKAGQIAMMTKGVVEDNLPEHTYKAGMDEIKGRFGKITVFFFITNAIKNIFRQIGRGFTRIGTALGGNTGNAITSTIDSAVQTLIGYLCDCCLGWIMYRQDINSFKAGCEGTVIFFKHGKTLIRNVGRIFGMGFLSLIVIGGTFFGLSYLIFTMLPNFFNMLATSFSDILASDGGEVPEFVSNPALFMVVIAAIIGIILWSIIHSVLIRPFILVGVLRNYMAAGLKDIPTEADFQEVNNKFPGFGKLYNRI